MATNITTNFDTIYLTAHLPENVYIGTNASSIEVSIYIDADKVFSSVYYPYNQVVCVRDIRSIVEAAMLDQELDMAKLRIDADEPNNGPGSIVENIRVIYSDFKSTLGSETFLNLNFLTTRKSTLIPRDGLVKLSNYTRAYVESSNYALIHYSVPYIPGEIFQYNCYLGRVQSTTEKIVTVNLTHAYFKELVDNYRNTDCKVHGVEYQIGARMFNIFFTDEQPTDVFSFINAFNVVERIYLYGSTTTKTEVSRSEAVCGRNTQFYDETVTVKHEVETAPMPYDEAMWLSQLFTSKHVSKLLDNNHFAQVLMTDITSEVTDSSKELVRLKFAWKYADGVEWL